MERSRNTRYPQQRRRRRRRGIRIFGRRVDPRRLVPFAFFLTIFIVSAAMLIDYGIESARRRSGNIQMAQGYEDAFIGREAEILAPAVEPVKTPEILRTPEPVQTPESTKAPQLLSQYHDFSGETPEKARKLYIQNQDLVGWLYIRGVVSQPVVQRDNEFYLNHGFDGKKAAGGTLFLDQYHPMSEETQHFLIHGHNMHDSSMFGIVSTYNKLSMVQNKGFAQFSTMYAPEDYVLYAVVRVDTDISSANHLAYVGTANFHSEDAFYAFTDEIREKSLFEIPVDVEPGDALLSLSTCIDDDRLLVCFRRMRENETKDQLQQLLNQAKKR